MNIEGFRAYCLAKHTVTESLPFDENVLVFKVAEKMFSATDLKAFESVNLKCDPDRAIDLRERYSGIIPGYHMNKKHWNSVMTDGSVTDDLIHELIDHSYNLVVGSFSKVKRGEIENGTWIASK